MKNNQKEQSRKYAVVAALAADDKKAENIRIIDVGDASPITDYVILVTASSTPQINAVDDEIEVKLKEAGSRKLYGDGAKTDMWRVADYGGFIIHILNEESREFYALDKLFAFGKDIEWLPKKQAKTAAKKAAVKKPAAKKAAPKTSKAAVAKVKGASKKAVAKTVKAAAKTTVKKASAKKPAAKKSKK